MVQLMTTDDIIREIKNLEMKILQWKPEEVEQNNDLDINKQAFPALQNQLDDLLQIIQKKPQVEKDKINSHLSHFKNCVQEHYDRMLNDINTLRTQIDEMKTHSRAIHAYGIKRR